MSATLPITEFSRRVTEEWLPAYCKDPARNYGLDGFKTSSMRVTELDAINCMRAIDSGLVSDDGGGRFRSARSSAFEVMFWEGQRSISPRPITLWIEPIITMASAGRLHHEFCWPTDCIGMQSKTWAFDLVAYSPTDLSSEHLVCEVKKSAREVDSLINFMRKHLNSSSDIEHTLKGAERNAFKKVQALRTSNCEVFWALGPNLYGYVFKIVRGPDSSVQLIPTDEMALLAPD